MKLLLSFPLLAIMMCCSLTEEEVAQPMQDIEIEGSGIATNYQTGKGFVVGGTDPAPFESATITDASQLIFANDRTDPFTYNASSEELQLILNVARQRLGEDTRLRSLSSQNQPELRLQSQANAIQFIVNQYYEQQQHRLLVTWGIPPGWSSSKPSTVLIFTPGMGHSNNSKLFGEPLNGFFEAYCYVLQQSQSRQIILIHLNCGGRTASAIQPGWETTVNSALQWGTQHLGIDRSKLVLTGASRGGYASFVLGARLHTSPDNQVRGIFSSVFGSAVQESQHYELVPSDLESKFRLSLAEYNRRIIFTNELETMKAFGPIGGSTLLQESSKPPVVIYAAFGSADPTMLLSSTLLLYHQLKDTRTQALFEVYAGVGHNAGNDQRNMKAANTAAQLSDNLPVTASEGYRVLSNNKVINQSDQIITHLRLPRWLARTVNGSAIRKAYLELVGPIASSYLVQLINPNQQVIKSWSGSMNKDQYQWLEFDIPAQGDYTVTLIADGEHIGSNTLSVKEAITENDITDEWRPDLMPVIFKAIR